MIIYITKDPCFYFGGYAESGSEGYDGPGWYIWEHTRVLGPFGTEQEAAKEQSRMKNKESDNE
tara:strand:- start:489 stop:677 length:189 start_codon:yes stop_codon:yes gene_type:complete